MKASAIAIAIALCAVGCARTGSTQSPQLAFAAPVEAGPCSVGATRVVDIDVRIPVARARERIIARPAGSHLVLWIDGTVERGYSVRGVVVSPQGVPIGAPFAVSDEKHAALATLDATFVDDVSAEVTYYSSNERGFELVTTSIVCEP